MFVAGSTYWNLGIGRDPGDVGLVLADPLRKDRSPSLDCEVCHE